MDLPNNNNNYYCNCFCYALQIRMAGGEGSFVPDMPRRSTMNAILVGAVGVSTLGLAVPYLSFFVPRTGGAAGGGLIARDALGNDVTVAGWKVIIIDLFIGNFILLEVLSIMRIYMENRL